MPGQYGHLQYWYIYSTGKSGQLRLQIGKDTCFTSTPGLLEHFVNFDMWSERVPALLVYLRYWYIWSTGKPGQY